MLCHASGVISLDLHLCWCSMDYHNIVCLIRISGFRKLCLWSHCPIVYVFLICSLHEWTVKSCLANHQIFFLDLQTFSACDFIVIILGMYMPLSLVYCPVIFWNIFLIFSVGIFVLCFFCNSNTSLPFSQTKLEWFIVLIYAPCYFLLFDAYEPVSYVYWCQIYYCLKHFSSQQSF